MFKKKKLFYKNISQNIENNNIYIFFLMTNVETY